MTIKLRMMLTEQLEYWGPGTLQHRLDAAYKDFVSYCKMHRLNHSQPPFKVSKMFVFWYQLGKLSPTEAFSHLQSINS